MYCLQKLNNTNQNNPTNIFYSVGGKKSHGKKPRNRNRNVNTCILHSQ